MPPFLLVIFNILMSFVPWLVVALGIGFVFSRSALGQALIEHLRAGEPDRQLIADLAGEVDALRREMTEVYERLEFAERLLAAGPAPREVLPAPAEAEAPEGEPTPV